MPSTAGRLTLRVSSALPFAVCVTQLCPYDWGYSHATAARTRVIECTRL
jgi:hypothetical protein